MSAYWPFVVSGLVAGSVYAIAALGLVVSYRTTGLFNFAHGAVGMVVAFVYRQLQVDIGLPTPVAFAIALVLVAPLLGAAVEGLLFRSLTDAAQASKIAVSVGLLILLQGSVLWLYGARPRPVAPIFPTSTVQVGSLFIGYDQIAVVAIGGLVFGALSLFFRRARVGVTMRAVVDDPALIEAAGFRPERLRLAAAALGSTLAGLAGILFSPLLGLDAVILTLLVVHAYAAAVFGRLENLSRTFAGAMVLGVAGAVLLKALAARPLLLNGVRSSLPFILLFALLLFARPGSLRELGSSAPWRGAVAQHGEAASLAALVGVLGVALLLPDAKLLALGTSLVLACSFLSITALTGSSGLVSLCPAGLVGAGAFAYAHLVNDAGVPPLLAVLIAGLAVVPLGLAIAVPALRLPTLFLALATFGFGQLMDGLLFGTWSWFSGGGEGVRAGRPSFLAGDRAYVVALVGAVALFVLVLRWLRQSSLGWALVAFRDNAAAAQMLGLNPLWPRVSVFALSSALAGVSGALYLQLLGAASRIAFSTVTSLLWVAVVVVGGVSSTSGALVAAALFSFLPALTSPEGAPAWVTPLFGVGAILLARREGGLVGSVRRTVARVRVPDGVPTAAGASAS